MLRLLSLDLVQYFSKGPNTGILIQQWTPLFEFRANNNNDQTVAMMWKCANLGDQERWGEQYGNQTEKYTSSTEHHSREREPNILYLGMNCFFRIERMVVVNIWQTTGSFCLLNKTERRWITYLHSMIHSFVSSSSAILLKMKGVSDRHVERGFFVKSIKSDQFCWQTPRLLLTKQK